MRDYSAELAFAIEAARSASGVAARYSGRTASSEQKQDGTWVTEADLAAERAIRDHIRDAFPDHNVLGEEDGLTAAIGGAPTPDAPTWVVDPIDGTNNFMRDIPIWATLIGLRLEGRMVVGVCHAPLLDELYDGAEGMGARRNGDPIHVDPVARLEDALFVFASGWNFIGGDFRDLYRSLAERCRRSRGFGDFWGHMLVARGAAHVMVEDTLKPWDVFPLLPIVSEAGGRVTHLDGREWADEGSCLTTNGALHEEVLGLARSHVATS
jgi:histidinol-phosphatase